MSDFFIVEVDGGKVQLYDNAGNVITSSLLATGKYGLDVAAVLADVLGNKITSTDLGSGKRGLDVNAILSAGGKIIIRDGTNEALVAKVNESGYLYTVTPPPATPPGKTEVFRNARGSVGGSTIVNDTYVIPNGVTLNLTHFEGGFQGATYDSCVSLYYAPNGVVDASAVILAHGYCASSNYQKSLSDIYVGNGTRAIIARRQRLDGVAKDGYFMWKGWY